MARGWESKYVEEQQTGNRAADPQQSVPSPASDAHRVRERQTLEMQRERILAERTSSPHRRSALELALADIEEKLVEFGWTVHL